MSGAMTDRSVVPHRAAPTSRRILAQARFETMTLLRNGEQLLVSLVLPALALVGLAHLSVPGYGTRAHVDTAVPATLALAIVSTAFTGQAISTGFDRRYGVLRLLGASPLGRPGLLAGKAIAVILVEVLQFVALGALGVALGWRPTPTALFGAAFWGLLGTWVFVALALVLAGTLRAEAVLALANLIWVLLLAGGGVVASATTLPQPVAGLVSVLPSAALADGMRSAVLGGPWPVAAMFVLLVWGVLATLACVRWFRWSD